MTGPGGSKGSGSKVGVLCVGVSNPSSRETLSTLRPSKVPPLGYPRPKLPVLSTIPTSPGHPSPTKVRVKCLHEPLDVIKPSWFPSQSSHSKYSLLFPQIGRDLWGPQTGVSLYRFTVFQGRTDLSWGCSWDPGGPLATREGQ